MAFISYLRRFFRETTTALVKKVPVRTSLLVCLFLLYITAAHPLYRLITAGNMYIKNSGMIQKTLMDIYPQELTIHIQSGRVSTNVKEPYYITVSQNQINTLLRPDKQPSKRTVKMRLLAIDTKAKAEDFDKYQSYVLLNSGSLIYVRSGNITVMPLDKVTTVTVSKETVNKLIADFQHGIEKNKVQIKIWAVILLFFILHGMVLVFGLLAAFTIIWLAVIVRLMLKIKGIDSTQGNAARFGLRLFSVIWVSAFPLFFFTSYEAGLFINSVVFLLAVACAYGLLYRIKETNQSLGSLAIAAIAHPVFIFRDIIVSRRPIIKKIVYALVVGCILLTTWKQAWRQGRGMVQAGLIEAGLVDKPTTVPVYGTSMLPTIKNGEKITLSSPKKYLIERGDIVSFRNDQTEGLYYLKRVIGMPGDAVLIKDGDVYVNNKLLNEPYVQYGPTYGNEFIAECSMYRVPQRRYLVMGDNRIVSFDSRAIGYVEEKDIDGVIKAQTNPGAKSSSRGEERAILKGDAFINKYNYSRTGVGLSPVSTQDLLNEISEKKAVYIASHLASHSDFSSEEELRKAGYAFTSISEFVTYGALTGEQVLDQIGEQSNANMDFYSNTYTEIGIGQANARQNECTIPVTVVIIARPDKPTYAVQTVTYWKDELKKTKAVLDQVHSFVGFPGMDQSKLSVVIKNVEEGYGVVSEINRQIDNKQWIDDALIKRYDTLTHETQPLMDKLYEEAAGTKPASFSNSSSALEGPELNCSYKGLKTVEGYVAAKIVKVWTNNNRIYARVSFTNDFGIGLGSFAPYMLVMKAKEITGFPEPAIGSATLNSGETVIYDFSYQELPDKPYQFVYMGSKGNVELAQCQ